MVRGRYSLALVTLQVVGEDRTLGPWRRSFASAGGSAVAATAATGSASAAAMAAIVRAARARAWTAAQVGVTAAQEAVTAARGVVDLPVSAHRSAALIGAATALMGHTQMKQRPLAAVSDVSGAISSRPQRCFLFPARLIASPVALVSACA